VIVCTTECDINFSHRALADDENYDQKPTHERRVLK
jgi:hypothetical protein